MRRRTYLSGLTVVATALAGCGDSESGTSDDETPDESSPEDTPSESSDRPQPTVAFDFDYASDSGELTVSHTNGDRVKAATLYLRGDFDGGASGGNWASDHGGSASGDIGGEPAVTAGDSATVEAGSAYELSVVWEIDGQSATLSTDEGPDA